VIQLKPQDVVVALKLAVDPSPWTYPSLARRVGLSVSEAHAAVHRGVEARLIGRQTLRPLRRYLIDFLIHGVAHVFVPERGEVTRGIRTAHAAPPLETLIAGDDLPPVWAHPDGETRGISVEPLYPSAVKASLADKALYECLALVDCLRIGRVRERQLAADLLEKRLGHEPGPA
jgi:hypothetical protein